jgi:dihydroorotate dehydrogenase (NAD+) catalytic subunit
MAELRVDLCGVPLKNPITTASGTFGFGHEYSEFFDLSRLGGIGVKGLTPTERTGNPAPRIAETPAGMLNCVGLQNPGIERFIAEEIPYLRKYDTAIIANVSGNTVEEYEHMVERISEADVDLIEMNISCPNVKCGGMAFGTQPKMVEEVVSAAKAKAKKPLFVKLSPNVTDIAEIARAAVSAGADGLSLINTLLGMRIDIETRKPILSNIMGGLSGPAVFPVAVRMVYQVRKAVDVPIIGMGGIRTGRDVVEMLLAGADAVALGTARDRLRK